jgi:hypothetical protein
MRLVLALIVSTLTAWPEATGTAHPQDSAPKPADIEQASQWKLEQLEMRDGTVYAGLILAETDTEIEFAEIVRPPGKPMFAIVRPVDSDRIAKKLRLEPAEYARLLDRFDQFRNRARIEAGRMEKVELGSAERDGTVLFSYQGPWFRLESSADEEMTRRCVVRVEQIFRAYRQLLPPEVDRRSDLRLLLFGSMDEYRAYLRAAGLAIASPAFYSASENLVVAGSQLNSYARRLRQVRAQNKETRRQYQLRRDNFPQQLAAVTGQLKQRGYSEREIEEEAKLRTAVWQREYDEAMARLDVVDLQNEAKFTEVTRDMFARLYHEAFHAYLDSYVYPGEAATMPRWMDEGIAQIFESGRLEADTLRVDAPDPDRLARLQADLSGDQPLSITEVLNADEQDFLSGHKGQTGQRCYLYSWGLSFYLTFEMNLFNSASLEPFVVNEDRLGPAARFTRLVGMPIAKFQRRWRQYMLELR